MASHAVIHAFYKILEKASFEPNAWLISKYNCDIETSRWRSSTTSVNGTACISTISPDRGRIERHIMELLRIQHNSNPVLYSQIPFLPRFSHSNHYAYVLSKIWLDSPDQTLVDFGFSQRLMSASKSQQKHLCQIIFSKRVFLKETQCNCWEGFMFYRFMFFNYSYEPVDIWCVF